MKTNKITFAIFSALAASALLACSTSGDADKDGADELGSGSGGLGRINASLTVPEDAKHDVAMVQFNVVEASGDCSDVPLVSTTSAIEDEALVESLDFALVSGNRAFADGLMTLPPGDYKVCIQPLQADGSPSDECAAAEGSASVFPEQTTEIVLVSQCNGVANGALDVVATLNDPPLITNINISESKFITTCETATITVDAEDPNNDALTYQWEQVSGPIGGALMATGGTASFTPNEAGDYEFRVTVFDETGAQTSLTFPVYVSEADGPCLADCPEGTVQAAGFCWVQAEQFESGVQSCGRFGLTGAASAVEGVPWTPEMMEEVTSALGCDNGGQVSCCQSALYIDPATNQCTTNGFNADNGQNFVNALSLPDRPAAVHLCQRPTL